MTPLTPPPAQPEPPAARDAITPSDLPASQGERRVADIDRELTWEEGLASLGRAFELVCRKAEGRS